MSSMEPGTSVRPARIAAFALFGVAAVALIMGVVSLFSSGGANDAAKTVTTTPPTSSAAVSTSHTTSAAPTSTTVSSASPTTTTTAATQAPPGPAEGQVPAVPVRVYNNGTVKGLAAQAATDFRNAGWNVTAIANYSQGIIATTTVYYRPGTDEEDAAKRLAQRFRLRVEPRFDGIAAADAGVIVIVTNDYPGPPSNKE
ncbi:MAG: LytR C-terminal domain-containing protein [Kutzneria sp.]|nr:LytR C-terminal domain-containing protein [Kutzneria sp.]MBV9846775.1 LytR C-terminal domain-containing protein [Kutzneria sp.]